MLSVSFRIMVTHVLRDALSNSFVTRIRIVGDYLLRTMRWLFMGKRFTRIGWGLKKARNSGRIVTDALHKSGFPDQGQWIHLGQLNTH